MLVAAVMVERALAAAVSMLSPRRDVEEIILLLHVLEYDAIDSMLGR